MIQIDNILCFKYRLKPPGSHPCPITPLFFAAAHGGPQECITGSIDRGRSELAEHPGGAPRRRREGGVWMAGKATC